MTDLRLDVADVPHIGGTPWYGFAVRVHAALLDAGLCDPRDPLVHPADGAVAARVGDEQVGVVTYRYSGDDQVLRACAAFVLPDYRRRGVMALMMGELVKVAERRGASRIEAATLATNEVFRRAAVAAGMRLTYHVYSLEVEGEQ